MNAATDQPDRRSLEQVDAPRGQVDEGVQGAGATPAVAGDQRDPRPGNAECPGGHQNRGKEAKERIAGGSGWGGRAGFGRHEGSFHEDRHDAAEPHKQEERHNADSGHHGADHEARPDDVARGGQRRSYAVQIGLVLGHGPGMRVAGEHQRLLGGADVVAGVALGVREDRHSATDADRPSRATAVVDQTARRPLATLRLREYVGRASEASRITSLRSSGCRTRTGRGPARRPAGQRRSSATPPGRAALA